MTFDLALIGGGIVGLATAYQFLKRFPNRRIVIFEKESRLAEHQTGRNSGVLHSGIYYKPGSLKARHCRQGKKALEDFCQVEGIPFERCGKVIVAISEEDRPALQNIFERGQANQIQCSLIDRARLAELEPHAQGVAAIHVPETGIIDYQQVSERLATKIREQGGEILLGARVTQVRHHSDAITVLSSSGERSARMLVNCSGLHSDRVAKLTGLKPRAQIIPFRGEYYSLKPSARRFCQNLIYPTPDPQFPFLGVHFTRMIAGSVECGPNAVLAFAREGYDFFSVNPRDLFETITSGGFLRLARKHWKMGLGEMWRSLNRTAFVRALQRLVPAIQASDLVPAPAGIRAQAVTPDGALVDDFVLEESDRVVNVCNAPSPAATASLQIGQTIVDRLASRIS